MDAYTGFAEVYDRFMEEVPYEQWKEQIVDELHNEGITDGLVLDLGCGTGAMTRLLQESGYDMIGVDLSMEMLNIARENGSEGILYLCQDMREFELYGTVKAVVSVCDSMNYITEASDLVQVLSLVNNYLDPGGVFIFDMNTIYKFKELMGDATIAESLPDAAFIWENYYDEETKRNEYDLTVFVEREDGLFERSVEVHEEQGYEIEEVLAFVEQAGMEFVKMWDADTKQEPNAETERIFYMVREKGKQSI